MAASSNSTARKEPPRNPLLQLAELGQSVWIDFIDRKLVRSGELARMVRDEGLRGLTSNPAIFAKSIGESGEYDDSIRSLLRERDRDAKELFEALAAEDLRQAADILRTVYDSTEGRDGFVSMEVSPVLARDTEGSIAEARRLRSLIARPNLMVKIPGTPEGVPAIERLISEGINVNVTLLFSQEAYRASAEAYMRGLESLLEQGKPVDRMSSVASFFVSRIDSLVDKRLEQLLAETTDPAKRAEIESLRGKVAIANARQAYRLWRELHRSPRWKRLEARGARPQRLLWASTGTKDPKYRDTYYLEELIGEDTVTTVPPATLRAFEDHGRVRPSLTEDPAGADQVMAKLAAFGIRIEEVTQELLTKGLRLFVEPYEELMGVIERKRRIYLEPGVNPLELNLPILLETAVGENIKRWKDESCVRRLWARDRTLWTSKDENRWMGWLDIVQRQLERIADFRALQEEIRAEGLNEVVLLGMGGSSLGAEVIEMTFEAGDEFPELNILDSTNPDQIRALESNLNLSKTLFVVSSKSGTTLEPNLLMEYFYAKCQAAIGDGEAGRRFVAITDPGSVLENVARERGFRRVFHGDPEIGGRYSVLSDFGMVPAALMGVDVEPLLVRAMQMVRSCDENIPPEENPGALLGLTLGTLALKGRDKLTVISSPEVWDLGAWLEQLLAESTGKEGKGLIPVSEEKIGLPETYGEDRIFVYLRLEGSDEDAELDTKVEALRAAGHPVIRIELCGSQSLGQEFFRWEMATAVAGSVLGINPFDQPDVESAKVAARNLTSQYEKTGRLPEEPPLFEGEGVRLFADARNREALEKSIGAGDRTLEAFLRAHLERIAPHDYFAILAFLEMSFPNEDALQTLRWHVLRSKKVATCLGFGPRYLHSTGQLYKGGSNSGVFLQITADSAQDIPIPGHPMTFGVVQAAQALGDFEVMAQRRRRMLRVHLLGQDVRSGLERVGHGVKRALEG